jgi:hypothetical protein
MPGDEDAGREPKEGPWNPGISSALTRELLALSTVFRAENVLNDLKRAIELGDVTGMALEELAIFRPERLALHEILVRVTADYEIPDPEDATVSDLGINFRFMMKAILARVIEANKSEIVNHHHQLRCAIARFIEDELRSSFAHQPKSQSTQSMRSGRGLGRWFRPSHIAEPVPAPYSGWDRDERILQEWTDRALSSDVDLHAAGLRSLVRVASAVQLRHGRIFGQNAFLGGLATDLACNDFGGEAIGALLEPKIREVAKGEGFRRLPAQDRPVLMVIKGASASGKSTMRPMQRKLSARLGLHWRDFALISPDIWRKVLLDFGSLGPLYKYAGMLTSHELGIIDRKLDRHLVRKGEQSTISHLLIDRFRFDSFALDSAEYKLLVSRFRNLICYFFMLTPPHDTVERAWQRGLEVGRYKAVDDLLAHNVEAYTGMQNILFGRMLDPNLRVHYEFLDNDVPRGEVPLTVAFGWSGEMNIVDIKGMLDIRRYQKINVNATNPAEVYPDRQAMAPENNLEFLVGCVRRFPQVKLADRDTGRIYARFAAGQLEWVDPDPLARAVALPDVAVALRAIAPEIAVQPGSRLKQTPEFLDPHQFHTLGRWKSRA